MPKSKSTPAPTKPADIQQGRTNLWKLNRADCMMKPGLNPRIDFGDIESLARQIAEHGIITPLRGTMADPESESAGKFLFSHGERRLKALDLAIENGWLDPKSPKALIPIQPDAQKFTDRERILFHVILNNAKPLDQFEQGRAFQQLIAEHEYTDERVAEELGYSITHIRDCLRLVTEASPALQTAVQQGRISATTAIEIVREVPDQQKQEEVLEAGEKTAAEAGRDRITARHLPIPVGKAAQASRRTGSTPFDGKEVASPNTDHNGEFREGVETTEIHFSAKGVRAKILTARIGGTFHIGWEVKWPGKSKDDGWMRVGPKLEGLTADTQQMANLLALQQIRAELEAKDFKDKPLALEDLDEAISQESVGLPSTGSENPAQATSSKPAAEAPQTLNTPQEVLKEVIKSIDKKDAEPERYATTQRLIKFLDGKLKAQDIAKFILGIEN